ncbi:hypothetical protein RiCNE_04600 [Rickettsia endosymbiont of Culicoides newsteadi]|nr:hypothetical protein RiCNE_04600 [Rickettsia endosymbiont of Culicoides newsteadi]
MTIVGGNDNLQFALHHFDVLDKLRNRPMQNKYNYS